MKKSRWTWIIPFLLILSCQSPQETRDQLFSKLSPDQTGIEFINQLVLTEDFDVFRYRNYYNGGGVALGDINNDGLTDIYLTANMGENRLYLNKGDLKFEDISEAARVGGEKTWSTGVSMVDINGDGWLDVYLCNSGDVKGGKRRNELFINNQDLTFTEKAVEYGLADNGFSTHAVFFDYDLDNDLDCYILNNSFRPVSSLGLENIREERDTTGGDKLYRNDGGFFKDVSDEAGIYGSVIGFGLGVTVGDINLDGWPDLYISNDFFERDYLYMNQKDGTFQEELPDYFGHISLFSMGADLGDLNNDGYPEVFVTDMLPDNNYRLKTTTNFDNYEYYMAKKRNGYHEQFMRNMLHLNNGDGTFSEIGQLAGVHATDWSWGGLISDFNNDGNKDIFVTNGIYKDVTNQDFIAYMANEENILAQMRAQTIDFKGLVDRMPSTKIKNFMFSRSEGLKYEDQAEAWGLDEPSFSNGAAYGDLDNDGDLDLIVNNVNQELFFYRNNAEQLLSNNSIRLQFVGESPNKFGVGARVNLYAGGNTISAENMPMRGFQSSMDYKLTLGVGEAQEIDSLVVFWGDKKKQVLKNLPVNQSIELNISDAVSVVSKAEPGPVIFEAINQENLDFVHQEDNFVDFYHHPLVYHMVTREGPGLAVGDINRDGLDDLFIGGGRDQAAALFIQNQSGGFQKVQPQLFLSDQVYEDTDALFFDADNDGDQDLYVLSGGGEDGMNPLIFQDRLYIQEGVKGGIPVFQKTSKNLPPLQFPGSCVKSADFDKDGDIDLFVGGRNVPGKYGIPATSVLLENDGTGHFSNATLKKAPKLNNIGLVTDAEWVDFDGDDDLDLVLVGEWMPVILFKNNGLQLERLFNVPGLTDSQGWWNCIKSVDIDQDGDQDLLAGNWGTNNKFKYSPEEPIKLFVNDFDDNGTLDPIFAHYEEGKLYPMALRDELFGQLNFLKKKFIHFEDYADKTLEEIFTPEQLSASYAHEAKILESSLIINNGDGSYQIQPLPERVQFSPVFDIALDDFDKDGTIDFLVGGNFLGGKPEVGRYDANYGLLLKYQDGAWKVLLPKESGFFVKGDVRQLKVGRSSGDSRFVFVAKNNGRLEGFKF